MSSTGPHKLRRRGLAGLPLRLMRSILRRFGRDLVPYTKTSPPPDTRATWLKKLDIDLAIDVGANEGQFVELLRMSGYSRQILSFEPLVEPFARLRDRFGGDPLWRGVNCALGEETGTVAMHVSGYSPSSSLLPMLDTHVAALPESAVVDEVRVPVVRLETAVEETGATGKRIFLKVDTQGFEASVLRGAGAIIDQIAMMELELSLVPLYEKQVLVAEMLTMVSELGFTPIWMEPGFLDPKARRLLQIDVLFARTEMIEIGRSQA